jgi:hypothetical protein
VSLTESIVSWLDSRPAFETSNEITNYPNSTLISSSIALPSETDSVQSVESKLPNQRPTRLPNRQPTEDLSSAQRGFKSTSVSKINATDITTPSQVPASRPTGSYVAKLRITSNPVVLKTQQSTSATMNSIRLETPKNNSDNQTASKNDAVIQYDTFVSSANVIISYTNVISIAQLVLLPTAFLFI